MPLAEFEEWQVYEQLEPFGEKRDDLRFGYLLALLANINRKKNAKAFQPWDVLPLLEKPKPSPQTLVAQLSSLFGRPHVPGEELVPTEGISGERAL